MAHLSSATELTVPRNLVGQRQRIALARALYRRPAVLILDEGTAALDATTEEAVMRALADPGARRTLIVVAHRLSTVRMCDRVVLLRSGRIIDSGTLDELALRHSELRQIPA